MKPLLFFGVVFMACNPHKVTENPAPPVSLSESFASASEGALPEKWWEDFQSEQLNDLVEKVLANNLDLRAAWARYQQARVIIAPAKYWMLPEVGYNARYTNQKTRLDFGEQGELFPKIEFFSAALQAQYEIDIWKRLYSQKPKVILQAGAFRNQVSAVAMTLAAQTTEAWVGLVTIQSQKRLLAEQLDLNQRYLELTEKRLARGIGGLTALDVFQQRQQVSATKAAILQLESTRLQLLGQLALLVGTSPSHFTLEVPSELPAVPKLPGLGLPSDLLSRRPDVRAAMQLVEAADHEVAIAVASLFPRLTISGAVGPNARSSSGLFDSALWNLVVGITGPIFNRGVLKAQVRRQKWAVQEQLANFGKTLLVAVNEVETSMGSLKAQEAYMAESSTRVDILEKTVKTARSRYEQGTVDYLVVLTSLQALQQGQVGLLQLKRQQISYYVQLCRALGGTWTSELKSHKKMKLQSLENNK